jgi:hypothetical protein
MIFALIVRAGIICMTNWLNLFIAVISIYIVNIVFGYWRANTRKFSLPWIAAIHVPVPIAIGLRFLLLGWSWPLIPVFVADFFAGQYSGGWLRKQLSRQQRIPLTSSLINDVFRLLAR